jgi:hypothetical protein
MAKSTTEICEWPIPINLMNIDGDLYCVYWLLTIVHVYNNTMSQWCIVVVETRRYVP